MAFPLLLALSAPPPGCQILADDAILARDVAAVVPAFGQVPGDFRLGFVPDTGAPRIFRAADLERLAKNQGVDLPDAPDVCFALHTFNPQPADIEAAMRTTLAGVPGIEAAKIEISSSSAQRVPYGELIFPRAGLQLPAGTQLDNVWRGFVRHGAEQFPVWARVRITAHMTRVVATANIPSGKPIQKSQVRLESCEDSLLDETTARSLDEVVGYLPKSLLRAYLPIRKTQLAPVPDVAKGELVDVQVFAGPAHLEIKAKAESDGSMGSTILLRNLSSGKEFSARVTGKNRVLVGDVPVSGGIQ